MSLRAHSAYSCWISPGAAAALLAFCSQPATFFVGRNCRAVSSKSAIWLNLPTWKDVIRRKGEFLCTSLMPQFRRRVLQRCMRARTQIPIPTARTHSRADFVNYVIEIKRLSERAGAQSANFLYIDKNVGAKISSRHVHMLRKRHGKLQRRRLIWGQRRPDVSLCSLGDAYLFGRHAPARTHTLRPKREKRCARRYIFRSMRPTLS